MSCCACRRMRGSNRITFTNSSPRLRSDRHETGKVFRRMPIGCIPADGGIRSATVLGQFWALCGGRHSGGRAANRACSCGGGLGPQVAPDWEGGGGAPERGLEVGEVRGGWEEDFWGRERRGELICA